MFRPSLAPLRGFGHRGRPPRRAAAAQADAAGLTLFGGPGFLAQVEHKLRAYTWNVVDRYEALVLDVREVGTDGHGQHARFSSRRRFIREPGEPFDPVGDLLHDEATFRVRARPARRPSTCAGATGKEITR